ncbi:hypothetical protein EE612_045936, partial [Oryza sativa]
LVALAPEDEVEAGDDEDGADDAAEVEALAEGEGGHDGHHQGLDGLIHRHEHRAPPVDAPYLHRERHPRRDEYGVKDGEELGAGVEGPGVGVPLHEGGDDEELDDAEEAGV